MPDIFVWAFVFLVPLYLAPTPKHIRNEHFYIVDYLPYLFSCLLLVVTYYLNYHFLVPRFYVRRKYIPYFLCLIGIMWLLLIVPEVDHLFRDHPEGPRPPGRTGVRREGFARVFHFTYFELQVLIMGVMGTIVSTFLRITRELRKAEGEKKDAELAYLKAQVNPHFLFNTLNSIYSLAYKKSEQAAPAIVKLSGLMRYVITEAQEDKVLLSKELEYVSNYIELQRLRLTPSTSLHFSVVGDFDDKLISPMIFLPFIENAFKYGVNPEKESEIRIAFNVTTYAVQLEVSNSVVTGDAVASERIGIGNSKERLERLYPGSYLLNIKSDEDKFFVSLNIQF
ncbi:MAG: hypothetical protein RL021_1168 [Bacteroidota bacterium]|jgi:hypothetical protein